MLSDAFFGNRQAKSWISSALGSGRFPHALLIDGASGSGRRTFARLIAQALLCRAAVPASEKPCGICKSCVKAASGNHPDIQIFSPSAGARSFYVETVRTIRSEAYISPNESAYKVYILTDIQNMTEQAQNALLKILEEPPSFVVFLLTCEGKEGILETVRSRCQSVSLEPVPLEQVRRAVLHLRPGTEASAAQHAAEVSGGVIGRALEALETGEQGNLAAILPLFVSALCAAQEYEFLKISGTLEKDKARFPSFLQTLPSFLRDALACKLGAGTQSSGFPKEAGVLGARLTSRQLVSLVETSLSAQELSGRYANKTLLLTWLFSRLWQDVHGRAAGQAAG